jgi:hypothetical protein
LRFFIRVRLVRRLRDLILDQSIGPRNTNGVDGGMVARIEQKRNAVVELTAVQGPGLDLHQRILRQLQTPHSFQLNSDPPARRVTLVAQQVHAAIRVNLRAIQPAVVVEVRIHLRARRRIALKRFDRVPAAESIAVQNRRPIAEEHGQVESLAIGKHAQLDCVSDRAAYKREIGGAIRPAGRSLIPHQRRPVS